MGLINFTGAELGSVAEFYGVTGNMTASTNQKHTGDYSFRCQGDATTRHYFWIQGFRSNGNRVEFSVAVLRSGFYFYVDTGVSLGSECIYQVRHVGGRKIEIRITSARKLALYSAGTTLIATGTTVLDLATWYHIELKNGQGNDAPYELRINENVELTGTYDLPANNSASAFLGIADKRSSTSPLFYYDDIVLRDDDWPGDCRISLLKVTGQGYWNQWNNGPNEVDEIPPDWDTSYIYQNLVGRKESTTLQTATVAGVPAGATFLASRGMWWIRTETSYNGTRCYLRYDSTEIGTTVGYLFAPDYGTFGYIAERAWTRDEVDSIEAVLHLSYTPGATSRCTMMNATVLWQPGAVPSVVRRPRYTPHAGI